MPRLPVVSGTEAVGTETVRAFEASGYERVRQSGSHIRLVCEGRQPLTVPLHRELKRGTLRALIRDAGLSVEEFVRLLSE